MKVFIGSSKEQLDTAKQVARWLEDWEHYPVLWSDGTVFSLGEVTLESLINVSRQVDAAIFIFGADDQTWFREKSVLSVRDNVLFEYGLFCGSLSRKRVIFLGKGNPKIASDLSGVTYADMGKPYNTEPLLKHWINDIAVELEKDNKILRKTGIFQVTDLFTAFEIAFRKSRKLDNFRVFAISTFKSVQMLRLMADLEIKNAYVLLRKYTENDCFYDENMVQKIENAISNWKLMVQKKNISNLYLSYFNYHPNDGFYIIDDRYWISGYYHFGQQQGDFSNDVILVDNSTELGGKWIQDNIERFNNIYVNYKCEEILIP